MDEFEYTEQELLQLISVLRMELARINKRLEKLLQED